MASTQAYRPFRLKTSLGADALLLDSFEGQERISTPFHFVLKALAPDPNIDIQSLLEQPVVLSFVMGDAERHIHGDIHRIKLLEMGEDGMAAYELEMTGWLFFLTLYSNCRIFQNKSVPDIIQKIFQDRGFTDFDMQLTGTYNPRDYCVQYRETDLNFISRLMEEEGIFYFFKQAEDKHTLVIADNKSAFAACPNLPSVKFLGAEGGSSVEPSVATLVPEFSVFTGTATHTDYDFTKPNTSLYSTLSGTQRGENYDYPGGYTTKDDGDRYARIRLEEKEVELHTLRGSGNCMGFECGFKFTLEDYFRDSENGDFTITALHHSGRNPSYSAGAGEGFTYKTHFEAIPNAVDFRPPRLARKPLIHGTQTAIVVGKSGEEIWTDQYGRVKVQFFWDREGKMDENSSCWIRVASNWAGNNWGFVAVPRIGHEVIVSFLEGDPDRPIIVGSVYNAVQMPPYALPDKQTKSSLKSLSSKGGGGFNEIRLEDNKGSEQIFIHGEKNMDIRLKNDEYKNIDNNQNLVVAKDRYEHIKNNHHTTIDNDAYFKMGNDHHLTIGGKQAIKVTGTHSCQVTGAVTEVFSDAHSETVSMSYYLKSGTGCVIEDTVGITLKCGSNSIVVDPTGVTVTGSLVTIDGKLTNINSGPGSPAGTGSAGSAVSPTAPTAPTDADTADPGTMGQMQAQQQQQQTATYGTVSPAAHSAATVAAATAAAQAAAAGSSGAAAGQAAGGAAAAAAAASSAAPPPKTWIEIQLDDKDGNPVPGEKYIVKLPDGSVAEGTLDANGHARVDGVDPGNCEVTFPNLDQTVWEPK